MNKKTTLADFVRRGNKIHNNKYDYTQFVYVNAHTKGKIRCLEHGSFEQTPNGHLSGNGCNDCAYAAKGKKRRLTLAEFIKRSKKIHGDKYSYSLIKEYATTTTPVKIICPKHGEFEQTPGAHLSGNGCGQCAISQVAKSLTMTTAQFIAKANKVHNSKYGYMRSIYVKSTILVEIICPEHGSFFQQPNNHLFGQGCPECAKKTIGDKKRTQVADFISKANKTHKNKYGYSKVKDIKNNLTKVEIICPKHGLFKQKVAYHLAGYEGCRECEMEGVDRNNNPIRLGKDEFIRRSTILHKGKYDYSLVDDLSTLRVKVPILCPEKDHGVFWQIAANHMYPHQAQGCPKCASGKTSSFGEIAWLDSLGIPNDILHRQVRIDLPNKKSRKKFIIADGYIPETNTIYEYYGDDWHGNPDKFDQNEVHIGGRTYGDAHKEMLERERCIKKAGLKIVSIWESEWIEHNRKLNPDYKNPSKWNRKKNRK